MDGPYREGKPLSEIIPPDRRKQRTAIVVIASMIVGAAIYQVTRTMLDDTGASTVTVSPTAPIDSVSPVRPGPLTAQEVEDVVGAHRGAVRSTCFEQLSAGATSVRITVDLVVGSTGSVTSAQARGDEAKVAACVEEQARGWRFPAHAEESTTIQVPFVFQRL